MKKTGQIANDFSSFKVLEIGYRFISHEVDCRKTLINLDFTKQSNRSFLACFRSFAKLATESINSKQYDLVISREMGRFIYRADRASYVNLIRWVTGKYLVLCMKIVKRNRTPIAIVDMVDEDTLDPRDIPLLRLATCYFKRELPANLYRAFGRVKPHHQEPFLRITSPLLTDLGKKLKPISVGFLDGMQQECRIDRETRFSKTIQASQKKYDVFFAGDINTSSVRKSGLAQLNMLKEEGYNVLILSERVDRQEFWNLMSESWLTWSPEGIGWDCYRHCEAALAGSVPLINYPSILRYKPLLHNTHAHYYGAEEGSLAHVAREALTDKLNLIKMATNAREHVLTFHTPRKRGEYVLRETIANVG